MAIEKMIFITGGVRSGKSTYAEKLVVQLAKEYGSSRLVYVASGVAFDEEMKERIERHQQDRKRQHVKWQTIEQPTNLSRIFEQIKTGDIILWDCVTTWLTNEFYSGFGEGPCCFEQQGCLERKITDLKSVLLRIVALQIPIVIVSNELFDEPCSKSEEVRLFQQWLGTLHQWLVEQSTVAIEMDHGIVQRWK